MSLTTPASSQPRAQIASSGPLTSCTTFGVGRVGEPGGQRLLVGDVEVRAEVDEGGVVVGRRQRDAGRARRCPGPRCRGRSARCGRCGRWPSSHVAEAAGGHARPRRRRSRPRPRARRWSAWRTAGRAAPGTAGCRRACAPRCGPTAGRRGRPGRGRSGTARSSSVSRRFCITDDRCSRSFSPTLPLTVSTWSTSASREPYSRTHLAAVFSPTLGMLGRLSLGSPRSAAKSGYCAGREAVLGLDLLRREAGHVRDALARVEHGDVLVDQLQGVAVAGGDQHVHALLDRLHGERGDDVVGLVVLGGDDRDVQRRQHLLDQADLAAEVGRALGPVGLVLGEDLAAEGLAADVEGDREVRGLLVAQDVDQHRREAVDGVRRLARRRGEVLDRQREEGPVGQRVPVEEQQPRARPRAAVGTAGAEVETGADIGSDPRCGPPTSGSAPWLPCR